ncbi:hypothetical protein INA60_001431 [Salmonella enterica]|nr:hypothetical protein [Salmonella enterica subsp. enterica serovar Kokomlemle]EGJ5831800.1 hypothetical protein [Salmonella enterica]
MKKYLTIAAVSLLLSGCKVGVEADVNTDELQSTEQKEVSADLNFEVGSCSSSEDSRVESDGLLKIKSKIPTIFKNAEYVDCYTKNFDSFAHFKIPVSVGVMQKDKPFKNDVYLYSYGSIMAGIGAKKELISRIRQAERDIPSGMDFGITINVNKGTKPFPKTITLLGVFADKDYPVPVGNLDFNMKKVALTLSDVSVQSLLEDGAVPFMVKPEYFDVFKGKD